MQISSYSTLDVLVADVLAHSMAPLRIITLLNDQPERAHNQGNASSPSTPPFPSPSLSIRISHRQMTIPLWMRTICNPNSTIAVVEEPSLESFYLLFRSDFQKLSDITNTERCTYVIDGLISTISILFSAFISSDEIGVRVVTANFEHFNFRKLYLTLHMMTKIRQLSNVEVLFNEHSDVWRIVNNVYLPCKHGANYTRLVEWLARADEEELVRRERSVLGTEEFVSLQKVLNAFDIRMTEEDSS